MLPPRLRPGRFRRPPPATAAPRSSKSINPSSPPPGAGFFNIEKRKISFFQGAIKRRSLSLFFKTTRGSSERRLTMNPLMGTAIGKFTFGTNSEPRRQNTFDFRRPTPMRGFRFLSFNQPASRGQSIKPLRLDRSPPDWFVAIPFRFNHRISPFFSTTSSLCEPTSGRND